MNPNVLTQSRPAFETEQQQAQVQNLDAMFLVSQQQTAETAVTEQYEASWRERAMNKIANVGHSVVEMAKNHPRIATGLAMAGIALGAPAAAHGETIVPEINRTNEKGVMYTETSTTKVLVGGSVSSAESFANLKIVGNHRTISKARVRKAIKRGQCDTISGKKAMKLGIRTQGKDGTGTGYALENRRSTMCDTNGDGKYDFRADCGNKAKGGRPQPKEAKQVIWVNNFNKTNVKVKTSLKVEASSGCVLNVPGGSVYSTSYASAESSASASVKLRNAVKAGGKNVASAKAENQSSLRIQLKAKASASAVSACYASGGTPTPEKPPIECNPSIDTCGNTPTPTPTPTPEPTPTKPPISRDPNID